VARQVFPSLVENTSCPPAAGVQRHEHVSIKLQQTANRVVRLARIARAETRIGPRGDIGNPVENLSPLDVARQVRLDRRRHLPRLDLVEHVLPGRTIDQHLVFRDEPFQVDSTFRLIAVVVAVEAILL
jgi:hypothetical protein